MASCATEQCFSTDHAHVRWQGIRITNVHEFEALLAGPVRDRVTDKEITDQIKAELDALASSGMAADTLQRLLAPTHAPEPWEVGEAIAECLLEEHFGALWPWNPQRDKRSPHASLPGADLVGFSIREDAPHDPPFWRGEDFQRREQPSRRYVWPKRNEPPDRTRWQMTLTSISPFSDGFFQGAPPRHSNSTTARPPLDTCNLEGS